MINSPYLIVWQFITAESDPDKEFNFFILLATKKEIKHPIAKYETTFTNCDIS